ncbi:hypothetical protein [Acinetobacter baumannii]|uniref:hypothetical protein n=1 Tax=Acinetobacter baumannii TaxID=470 RepID=UPI001EFDA310|nr:hypothetical protein [Acinetobacter baumannii]MCG9242111.1 hypothetical protein [Acinetobacter baumannii]MCQ1074103.1 hypothetical protein [Acinetobacter baumannii]MCQ1100339.1 hypothetical protein [Acinetobacter baumannii]MDA3485284.1 hypothetical protein [Acinetobacter baumannii]MDA3511777.1 hypothetical protein [Acinetobacter baumannii]
MNQLIFSEIQSNFEFGETRHDDESEKIKWNVLGHVYEPMVGGDQKSSFAWISNDPPGTFVPPHMHEPYRVCRRVNILRDYPDDKIKIYP